MQVTEKWAVRLPVIMLVVGVENERVGNLSLQVLDDRIARLVRVRDVIC
jgi:hypothetical protein